jgi:predicted CXXCH cytochrome family protein
MFFKDNDGFFVSIKEVDASENVYKIAYTFGVTPLQQYLVDFNKGKKQVLRVTWDTSKKIWYHQYKGDTIAPQDWLHWTKGAQNWNTMCAECHSTNLEKNYFIKKDSFHTTYSEINVACESCHGPAKKHVDWAADNPDEKDTYILKGINQDEQLNICASCHARRVKLTYKLETGKKFEDQYMIHNLSTNLYHGDGQIEDEDYVYGSFLQSKMYAEGVKCNDCHDSHSLQLKFEGNNLCLQCHIPADYDTKKHHFHQENTEASQCINCHMTGKYYMGNDFRRDHSFRIPRPDQSVKYGTPNACVECHQDKSNQWAAVTIKEWYGEERPSHFSDALLLSSSNNISQSERNMLDKFINNLQFPEIARATVIENLNFTNQDQYNTLLRALNDSSAIIRYNALLKFRALSPEIRKSVALRFMNDSIRLVRIGAAQLVIDLEDIALNTNDKMFFADSRAELETMLFSNADFSNGRMHLGDYYLQKNNVTEAIKHYKMALLKDKFLTPVYSNLEARETLDNWILIEPNLSRPHYLKALLNFEIGEEKEAVTEFNSAIKLDPNDTRSMYNLATYYYQENKDLSLAENYINNALKIEPGNNDYKYLLALIYREQGKTNKSQVIMQELRTTQ